MSFETKFKAMEAEWSRTLPGAGYYKVIRVDGRNFSKFTKDMDKPFDLEFVTNMDIVAVQLCKEIQGAVFAYVQSDEISVLVWQDADNSQQWFGGDVSKTLSISAGLASSAMSLLYTDRHVWTDGVGILYPVMFDSRVFTIPTKLEVMQYFLWRQSDAHRNAISMAASSVFSHKQLMNRTTSDRLEMLHEHGINFYNRYGSFIWNGRVVTKETRKELIEYRRKDTGTLHQEEVDRTYWTSAPAEGFDWDSKGLLHTLIPE